MKRSRLILIIVAIILIIGGVTATKMWNKPHPKAEDEKGIAMSTDSLIAEYGRDEKAADAKYLNKAIAVRGTVAKVEKNQDGQTTVLFASADAMSSVFCTMRDKGAAPDSGATMTLKGFCSGHTMDVLITDCVVTR